MGEVKQQLYEDLNYLLSCMRVRQNNFIFLLEKYKNIDYDIDDKKTVNQISYKFLETQQNHLMNIKIYLDKYIHNNYFLTDEQKYFEGKMLNLFWCKLKKLIKVSLQRIRLLNLSTGNLKKIYEEIVQIINQFIEQRSELRQIEYLEMIFKKKYMYAIFGNYRYNIDKQEITSAYKGSTNLDQKMQKNLSQSKTLYRLKSKKQKISPNNIQTKFLKSLNKQNFKKRSDLSLSKKFTERQNKQLFRCTQKIQDEIYDIIEGKVDLAFLDKKKSKEVNGSALYDQLFEKNIPNHKIITKFIFSSDSYQKNRDTPKKSQKIGAKSKRLLDQKKQEINKSNRKICQKKILKLKKKISDDQIQQIKQSFGNNRLKKFSSKLIKIRPKTAKNQRYEPEIRLTFEETKKRFRKLKKNLK